MEELIQALMEQGHELLANGQVELAQRSFAEAHRLKLQKKRQDEQAAKEAASKPLVFKKK